jgi:hypothetical protein
LNIVLNSPSFNSEGWDKDIRAVINKDYMIFNIYYSIFLKQNLQITEQAKLNIKPSKVLLTKFNGGNLEKASF